MSDEHSAESGARPRCEHGHLMKPNPSPSEGRPTFVHYWPQDLAECMHQEATDE